MKPREVVIDGVRYVPAGEAEMEAQEAEGKAIDEQQARAAEGGEG